MANQCQFHTKTSITIYNKPNL